VNRLRHLLVALALLGALGAPSIARADGSSNYIVLPSLNAMQLNGVGSGWTQTPSSLVASAGLATCPMLPSQYILHGQDALAFYQGVVGSAPGLYGSFSTTLTPDSAYTTATVKVYEVFRLRQESGASVAGVADPFFMSSGWGSTSDPILSSTVATEGFIDTQSGVNTRSTPSGYGCSEWLGTNGFSSDGWSTQSNFESGRVADS